MPDQQLSHLLCIKNKNITKRILVETAYIVQQNIDMPSVAYLFRKTIAS